MLGKIIKQGIQRTNKIAFQKSLPPLEAQEATLQKLLEKAKDTDFGRTYGFRDILNSKDMFAAYQEAVPMHDYNAIFDKWWSRMLDGEEDVCWAGRPKHFAMSSGTSGAPSKYIPVTNDMLKAMRRSSVRMLLQTADWEILPPSFYTKSFLMLGSSTELTERDNGVYVGDLSGINTGRVPIWFQRLYKPGKKIAKIKDWSERLELITKKAPKWDIGTISGIPAWIQLMLERIIETHKLENIHEIWPNFQVYTPGGVAFEPYRKGFEELLGKKLLYLDTYLASEGFLAFQRRVFDSGRMMMELVLDNGIFMEFVPFNEDNFEDGVPRKDAEVLTICEVKEGVDYALLISTCAGAWRYVLGDTVRFTDASRGEIIITGRTKHFLSICGEHLSVDNMNAGVRHVEEALDVTIREFTVAAKQKENGRFLHEWYLGCDNMVASEAEVCSILDKHLKQINADYATERGESVLQDVCVHVIPVDIFYKWQAKQGKLGGQSKFPRVMKLDKFGMWQEFVAEELQAN